MKVDPKWVVSLGGKEYPQWPGILDLAHRSGLKSIRTTLLQIPSEENGNVAIVQAEAIFEGDKSFQAIGDASPRNVNAKIASALIRMAETRAKGRALRDGTNSGETLWEELPDEEAHAAVSSGSANGVRTPHAAARAAAGGSPSSAQTGFEPTVTAPNGRHWQRPELIATVKALLAAAAEVGIEKKPRDLEKDPNSRLLAMRETLEQEIAKAEEAARAHELAGETA